MPTFSHLHCHTQYSLLDGQASIGALMKKAQADGMPAVALTDHGNMFGAFNFVAEANKYNVKPIVGCEFYLVEDRHKKAFSREKGERDVRRHQLLLAKDQAGYQNLAKLCSMSYIEGVYSKFPRIDRELLTQYHEGLIATSCCIGAELPQAILWKTEEEAEELLKWWLDLFGEDYYIEIQRHGLMNIDNTGKSQEDVNQVLLKFAQKYNVKVICTNDSHYVEQNDFAPHDLLLCVNTGEEHSIPVGDFETNYFRLISADNKVLYDHLDTLRREHAGDEAVRRQLLRIDEERQMPRPRARFGFPNDQFYFKSQAEMNALFADVPASVDNTNEIVDKITPPKLQRDILLPNFPLPPAYPTADAYLRHLTFTGAKKRYHDFTPEVEERLNYELGVIETMGFAGYFLITQDFINHGRSIGVAVGPGRGSAAGSAVAYCVGITNIDPIKYSLLFERFLNPERVSMPDIDIDFDDVNRQKVIDYVVNKYGKNQVAQIITFGTMAAKSSIKDVARAMNLPLPQVNDLTKMVPEQVGTTLDKAFAEVMELDMIRRDEAPDNLKGHILRLAHRLEGSVRNTGIHAAGVIIAPDDITKYIPVSTSKDSDLLVTQFDGKVIESAGMLKMDFLGLKTLTIIVDAINLIEKNHGVKIDIDDIPIDDEKTYELYQRGDTIGTFQFESEGMRMYLKDLRPTNIEDLIAMNALYRPGPMQFIPNFINRKHGKEEVDYPHELLKPILNNSYGICIYQEQIMQAAQIMAGYSLGGADLLRRAMGKKDLKKMALERDKFTEGAKKLHGIPAKKANEVFDVMEKFAQYGFNRSHSAAYSLLAYQTGYLKAHYPAEYMAAVLTSTNNMENLTFFMAECRRMGLNILGPDINRSLLGFATTKRGDILFGLGSIKGLGEGPVNEITNEMRENGPFKDPYDLVERINLRTIIITDEYDRKKIINKILPSLSKNKLEALIYAGALDSLPDINRAQFIRTIETKKKGKTEVSITFLDKLLEYGQTFQELKQDSFKSLFGDNAVSDIAKPKLPEVNSFSLVEKLRFEKEVLGLYLSGHPLDEYALEIKSYCNCSIDKIESNKNRDITLAGLVSSVMYKTTRNGHPFVSFNFEDYEMTLNIALFRDDFMKFKSILNPSEYENEQVPPILIKGRYQQRFRDSDQFEFKIQSIDLLSSITDKLSSGVRIKLDLNYINNEFIENFVHAVHESKGNKKLKICFNENYENISVDTNAKYSINPKIFINKMKLMGIETCQLI